MSETHKVKYRYYKVAIAGSRVLLPDGTEEEARKLALDLDAMAARRNRTEVYKDFETGMWTLTFVRGLPMEDSRENG